MLDKANAESENLRSRKKQIIKDLEAKISQKEQAKIKLMQVEEELENMRNKNLTALERSQRVEELCAEEEKTIDKINNDNQVASSKTSKSETKAL